MLHNNMNFIVRKNDVNTFLHTVATVCLREEEGRKTNSLGF